jgi:uncharacterized protein GlcG (DUF336 family)
MDNYTEEQFKDAVERASEAKRPVYVIFQEADGNWRGFTRRDEKMLQTRMEGPEIAMTALITHDGSVQDQVSETPLQHGQGPDA